MELQRNNIALQVNILDPTKEGKKGLFKKNITSYNFYFYFFISTTF